MKLKKTSLVILLLCSALIFVLPEGKAHAQALNKKDGTADDTAPNELLNGLKNTSLETINNIGKIVETKMPQFITKPIISAVGAIDKIRSNAGIALEDKKKDINKEIQVLNTDSVKTASEKNSSQKEQGAFLKPFKYTELFALALFSGAFNNKLIFYAILALAVFFLLRYIVKRVR